jgi:VanZ family protein
MNKTPAQLRLPRPLALLLAGLFMALILYTSTKPSPQVSGLNQSLVDHILDFAHFPIYALLTFLLLLALCSFDLRRQVAAFILAVSFGALNELVQSATPGRSCSLHDIIVNALGAAVTIGLVNFFRKKLHQ